MSNQPHQPHQTSAASTGTTFFRFADLSAELRAAIFGSCDRQTLDNVRSTSKQYQIEAEYAIRTSLQNVFLNCLSDRGISSRFAASYTNDSMDVKGNGIRAMKTLSIAINPERIWEYKCWQVAQQLSLRLEEHCLDVAYISLHKPEKPESSTPTDLIDLLMHLKAESIAISGVDSDTSFNHSKNDKYIPPYAPNCKQIIQFKDERSMSSLLSDYVRQQEGAPNLITVMGSSADRRVWGVPMTKDLLSRLAIDLSTIIRSQSKQSMTVILMTPFTQSHCSTLRTMIIKNSNDQLPRPPAEATLSRFTVCLADEDEDTSLGMVIRLDRRNKEILAVNG